MRVIMRLGQLAIVFSLGIVVGAGHVSLLGRLPGWIAFSAGQPERTNPIGVREDAASQPDDGPRDADRLLSELDSHLRRLLAERDQLEAAAKEDRIAYSLLRSRGYADDSPECRRLVNRQKQMEAAAARHDEMIDQTRQLQPQLDDVLDTDGVANSEVGLPEQLLADIRRCLSKSRVESPTGNEIPDERWSGGPDVLMKPDQRGKP
jgi:hypothetical protein